MTYLLKSNRGANKGRKVLSIIFGLFIFLLLIIIFAPNFAARTLQTIALPVWQSNANTSRSLSNFLPFFRSKESLVADNQLLTKSLEEARLKLLYLDLLERENSEIKEAFSRDNSENSILAAVLVRPPKTPYDVMVIDVGANRVVVGDLVLASGEVAIGTITDVYERTARVRLYSTAGVLTEVLLGTGGPSLTLRGVGNGTFELKVPRDIEVAIGDVITVPALNTKVVATVESVTMNPTDAFKTVLAKSPINIFSERLLTVITN